MKLTVLSLFMAVLLLMTFSAVAEEPAEKTDPPPPCGQLEAPPFDFWLGEWDVEAKGKVVGRNRITKIHGGCTVLEQYHAASGAFEGRNFNYFDLADSNWHQVRVDNSGTRLHLTGIFADGANWQVLFDGLYRPAAESNLGVDR